MAYVYKILRINKGKGKDLSCQDLLIKIEFIPSMGFGGTKKKIFIAEGILHHGLVGA